MDRRRLHPLIAVLLALLVLGAQQTAFAHMIGHTGAAAVTVASGDDEGHGAAQSLSHVCTTCVGLAALAAAPPPALPVVDATPARLAPTVETAAAPTAAYTGPYRARAPPASL